jgi:hypothetical protein
MVGNILALRVFSLHFFGEITKRCCCYDSVSFFYNFERFRFNHVFFLFEVTPNILCTQKKNRISKQFVLRKNQKISRRNSKQNMVKRKITRTKFEILC